MNFIDIVLTMVLALGISGLMAWGVGWRHPAHRDTVGPSLLFLFVILVLAIWVFGAWITPVGPLWQGTGWIGLLLAGLFVALLIMAASPPSPEQQQKKESATEEEGEEASAVATAFGVFFWILAIGLLMLAVIQQLR